MSSRFSRISNTMGSSRTSVRWGAVAAIAAAILLLAWVFIGGRSGSGDSASENAAVPAPPRYGPAIVSIAELKEQSATTGHTVFWLGAPKDQQLELTIGADNNVQIRYLPKGAEAGSADRYVTAASWPTPDPFGLATGAAQRNGGMSQKAPRGGIYVTNSDTPTNAFAAWPDSTALAEIFSPKSGDAWRLMTSDELQVLQP